MLGPYNVEWIVDVGRDRIMSDRSRSDNFDCERAVNTAWKSAEKLYISSATVLHRGLSQRASHNISFFALSA